MVVIVTRKSLRDRFFVKFRFYQVFFRGKLVTGSYKTLLAIVGKVKKRDKKYTKCTLEREFWILDFLYMLAMIFKWVYLKSTLVVSATYPLLIKRSFDLNVFFFSDNQCKQFFGRKALLNLRFVYILKSLFLTFPLNRLFKNVYKLWWWTYTGGMSLSQKSGLDFVIFLRFHR